MCASFYIIVLAEH